MGKENNPRRVAENEAFAKTKMLRTSPQKLNLVAQLIRGKKVDKALADLALMVGGLTLARALGPGELSDRVIRAAKSAVR